MENKIKAFVTGLLDRIIGKGTYNLTVELTKIEPTEKMLEEHKDIKDFYSCNIIIKGEDLDLLIGYRGRNLEALEQIIKLYIASIANNVYISTRVDINDYISQKEQKLISIVKEVVGDVKLLEEDYEFKPMPAKIRRLIHLEVQKYKGVYSHSIGEGKNRRVIVSPKK